MKVIDPFLLDNRAQIELQRIHDKRHVKQQFCRAAPAAQIHY